MAKVVFPFRVKYEGHFYAPRKAFEVAESEVDKLAAIGAKVVARSTQTLEKVPEKVAPKSTTRQTKSSAQKKE